ncbi:LysR substrate-binding domain-containing protein [Pantoea sp. GM01]|uniref:LysR substrate-binding domain-containing protein n=1 Tax=Pantoea sp. GM01 TaxID=1144320 RepID=UPI000310BD9A|nr:LysR substrate-binding domain-containing protein [Pantoea sp. GM01]
MAEFGSYLRIAPNILCGYPSAPKATSRCARSSASRLSSDASIGLLLQHVVADFSARYPDIQLDFAAQGALVDITAAGFDAGIRLIEDVPQDRVAVPIGGALTFVTVAAPAYLARRAAIVHPRDLLQHQSMALRLFIDALKVSLPRPS